MTLCSSSYTLILLRSTLYKNLVQIRYIVHFYKRITHVMTQEKTLATSKVAHGPPLPPSVAVGSHMCLFYFFFLKKTTKMFCVLGESDFFFFFFFEVFGCRWLF
jgi:hypothetical protein